VRNYVTLLDGQPYATSISTTRGPRAWDYYQFYVAYADSTVTFAVVPTTGDPDLYVRNDTNPVNDTAIGFIWNSQAIGRDLVRIRGGCHDCTYTIGVMAFSEPCAYTIVATTGAYSIALSNGKCVRSLDIVRGAALLV